MEEFVRIRRDQVAKLKSSEQQCPQCGKVYTFAKPPGMGTSIEREQHLSGVCSDACWKLFLGQKE